MAVGKTLEMCTHGVLSSDDWSQIRGGDLAN